MCTRTPDDDEHELPSVEAVLAGTLALMTGYSQALQAALHPEKRLAMGLKIGRQLAALSESAQLSPGFRDVLLGLQRHWLAITACTLDSRPALPMPAGNHDGAARSMREWRIDGPPPPPHRRH